MTTLARDAGGHHIQAIRPGVVQTVSVGVASAAVTNPFGGSTTIVRVVSTVACHYAVGSAPTATTGSTYLPAGVVEFVSVRPGEKVAFIRSAGDGLAYVTEGS